jgi:hypothetical protein
LDKKAKFISAGIAWLGAWAIYLLYMSSEAGLAAFTPRNFPGIIGYSIYILFGIPSALVGAMLRNRWIALIVGVLVGVTVATIMVFSLGTG